VCFTRPWLDKPNLHEKKMLTNMLSKLAKLKGSKIEIVTPLVAIL